MSKILSDYAYYVVEKINCSSLTANTYVGMDNLLPNRGGKTISDYVPSEGTTTAYRKGDILLGNIRPYFKKIWLAENDGGCSPDVLCVRCKEGISPLFLFAVLAQDSFFEYDVKGAKGSKMPRGDKAHIMAFPIPELDDTNAIGILVDNLYKKVENNTSICIDLEAMAKLLYDYWFVQFDFPDENGKPYKSSGGKMVWNEELKRAIPEGWSRKPLSFLSKMETDISIPIANKQYHHYSIPAFDDNCMPTIEDGSSINSNKYVVPPRSILVSKLNPQFKRIWYVELPGDNAICSTEFMPFTSKKSQEAFLYSVLNSDAFYTFMVQASSSSTGSRKRMDPKLCSAFNVPYPNNETLIDNYCNKISPMLSQIQLLKEENENLISLRDFLLPMLMNGQVRVDSCTK